MAATHRSPAHSRAVGREVARARAAAGLTQAALAARLEVSPSFVARAEIGLVNFTVGQLARFATALEAELLVEFDPARGQERP